MKTRLEITASESTRGGVYANFGMVKSFPNECIIDFIFIDDIDDSKSDVSAQKGMLQSRIIIPKPVLADLVQRINGHLEEDEDDSRD